MNAGEPDNSLCGYRTPWTPSDLSSIIEMINAAYEGRNSRTCPTARVFCSKKESGPMDGIWLGQNERQRRLLTWQVSISEI
jgi:hypothetical protein